MSKKLTNKVVWITGASSGIGEALAYALAAKDCRLILSARRKTELERVKGNCPAHTQPNIRILPLDVTESSTLALHTQAAIQLFGHIDILINNSGVSQRGFIKDTLIEVDRKLMEVNYFGVISLTKHLLPHFLKRKTGHFVVTSSITGIFGSPYRSGYSASKHALHGFFDSLRAELYYEVKDSVKVTIICPGFIQTSSSSSALTADGTPLGNPDYAKYKGRRPEWIAHKIVRAIEKSKEEVYLGGQEVLGVYIKRFFPKWFSRIIRKTRVR